MKGSPYPEVTDASVAEFLNNSYLVHLGILYPPTGVGLVRKRNTLETRFFLAAERIESLPHRSEENLIRGLRIVADLPTTT
jgi:hypothetical protein